MEDLHDIVEFPFNGEKLLGMVIKHYDHPLNDFYLIYSDNALYEYSSKDNNALLADEVYMPVYDRAITDYKLKKQHIEDMMHFHREYMSLADAAKNMDESIFL